MAVANYAYSSTVDDSVDSADDRTGATIWQAMSGGKTRFICTTSRANAPILVRVLNEALADLLPPPGLVRVRFDLRKIASNPSADHTGFVRTNMPCVPQVGQTVNLKGNPHVVIDVGWSVAEGDALCRPYAFVTVIPHAGVRS